MESIASKTTNDVKRAVKVLQSGGLVAFPTDTVYGVGLAVAYAQDPRALYAAKKRDAGKPIAWLVEGPDALNVYGTNVPDYARNLAHAFWPGALTLVVRASSAVPNTFQSGEGTIGLRMPNHPVALELVHAAGPLATSSANITGQAAPEAASDMDPRVAAAAGCVLEVACSGNAASGMASTVVDCTGASPTVLRQGSVRF